MSQIICGDALAELRKLPDESVHCCVTSPPYFGLRDYGTAKWEDGDPNCDHTKEKRGSRFASECSCGARRIDAQFGTERAPEEYVAKIVEVFREIWRVLKKRGTCWIVIGDSYASGKGSCFNPGGGESSFKNCRKEAGVLPLRRLTVSELRSSGLKPKDLIGIPWRVAFALQADGWYLRRDIVWNKPNPMTESVRDRPTSSHEYVFLMSKSKKYFYDAKAIKEQRVSYSRGKILGRCNQGYSAARGSDRDNSGGFPSDTESRNCRSVWTIATAPSKMAHFAMFPQALVEPMIKAGCPAGGIVLDPFFGAGTTGFVALRLGREFIGIDLNPEYCEMARKRIYGTLAGGHGEWGK